MEAPKNIKVGTVTYRVTVDRDDWVRIEHQTQLKGAHGFSDHHQAVIYINPDDNSDVQRQTLIHEILHAASYTILGNPSYSHLGKNQRDREERLISTLEGPLLQILRDNPDMVAYFVG